MDLKKLPLHHVHERLGGKMVPFSGFTMPVRYSSDKEEHMTVRNGVGMFDVSHMGEFLVKGPHALALIQYVCANDASTLTDGQAQYTYFPNQHGGIVDDLLVYKIKDQQYMLVVNAGNTQKDWDWINEHNYVEAELTNISDNYCLFAVQGPQALPTLQKLTSSELSKIPYYRFEVCELAETPEVIVSHTGYTGAGGFEIYVQAMNAEKVWTAIMKAGAEFDIKPIGLGARDTLRLEMGFCLYGQDIDDGTSPLEAGLGWVTKFTKSFINSDSLQEQKKLGINQKLVGFVMNERAIPRNGYSIKSLNGNVIGRTTSGSLSPVLNKGIGMGYVSKDFSTPESEIYIEIRNQLIKATVTKFPFI